MPLVIEDGTLIEGANSYATLVEIRAYAVARGVVLSDQDAVVEPLAIKAMDYLAAQRYKGQKVSMTQALAWPRKNVKYEDGSNFPSDEIPHNEKDAQCQLVIEQQNGVELFSSIKPSEGFVIRERIDVLETYYSENVRTTSQATMPAVDALLAGLLVTDNGFRSVRV